MIIIILLWLMGNMLTGQGSYPGKCNQIKGTKMYQIEVFSNPPAVGQGFP